MVSYFMFSLIKLDTNGWVSGLDLILKRNVKKNTWFYWWLVWFCWDKLGFNSKTVSIRAPNKQACLSSGENRAYGSKSCAVFCTWHQMIKNDYDVFHLKITFFFSNRAWLMEPRFIFLLDSLDRPRDKTLCNLWFSSINNILCSLLDLVLLLNNFKMEMIVNADLTDFFFAFLMFLDVMNRPWLFNKPPGMAPSPKLDTIGVGVSSLMTGSRSNSSMMTGGSTPGLSV